MPSTLATFLALPHSSRGAASHKTLAATTEAVDSSFAALLLCDSSIPPISPLPAATAPAFFGKNREKEAISTFAQGTTDVSGAHRPNLGRAVESMPLGVSLLQSPAPHGKETLPSLTASLARERRTESEGRAIASIDIPQQTQATPLFHAATHHSITPTVPAAQPALSLQKTKQATTIRSLLPAAWNVPAHASGGIPRPTIGQPQRVPTSSLMPRSEAPVQEHSNSSTTGQTPAANPQYGYIPATPSELPTVVQPISIGNEATESLPPRATENIPMAGESSTRSETAEITFWAQATTRTAELTLDADGHAVQVKVALSGSQGNEAHVTLLTDHAAERQALTSDTEQLRHMLQTEGLHLTGVTVGSGAKQSSQQFAQNGKQSSDRQLLAMPVDDITKAIKPSAIQGNGCIDVFV